MSASSSRSPARVSMCGALISCTDTIPCSAAARSAARYRAVRRAGDTSRATSRATWCASPVTQPDSSHPGRSVRAQRRASVVETTAE